MSTFRSFSEIVATMIQRLQLTQPNLDTKPGSVSRDLFIDIPADQLSRLYSAINLVSQKQSLATTSGRDLEKLAANFGISRNTGSAASGIAVFCADNVTADIPIPTGTLVTARNGATYRTIGNFVMSTVEKNRLAANASRMRKSLNIAGISAKYAIEIPVQAVRNGTSANISSLQIISTNLPDTVSVTNLTSMTGGANNETDDSFRSRILSVFSGANIGTSFGYRNALMGVDGVVDALVVEPGNSLMLRDGTETIESDDGSSRILNSGTGGKVDAYILGRKIREATDTYVFTDLSGTGDVSDSRNDYILGQSSQDMTRTSEERRVLAFKTGNIPAQPVDSIISVTGSVSGSLVEQYVDLDGNLKGNYVLKKDYNPETGGSPFGFDRISFVSGTKNVSAEAVTKKTKFGIDALSFSGIDNIGQAYSDIDEVNENSDISMAGSKYLKLLHKPVVKVNKIINQTTGEVYTLVDQELNSQGLNDSGIIEISGKTLPSSADVLSVSYVWRHMYDETIDYFDPTKSSLGDPSAANSIDWSSPGMIREEATIVTKSDDGLVYEAIVDKTVVKPVSVYRRDIAQAEVVEVSESSEVSVIGVTLAATDNIIENIISIKRDSDGLELYQTDYKDGSYDARIIYLPSDSQAKIGDSVTVSYNKVELFLVDATDGASYNNVITLPSDSVLQSLELAEVVEDVFLSSETVYVDYVADVSSAYPETNLLSLPITSSGSSNSLIASEDFDSNLSNQPISYEFDLDGSIIRTQRYGPAPVKMTLAGASNPGKIMISGESLSRITLVVEAGLSIAGHKVSLEGYLRDYFDLQSLPQTMGVGGVANMTILSPHGDSVFEYDLFGLSLKSTRYSMGSAALDSSLERYEFMLPYTPDNQGTTLSPGTKVAIDLFVYNEDDYEEVYFDSSGEKITKNRFARINRVSVSSGFRTRSGNVAGSLGLSYLSQPEAGDTYYVDYSFSAPKEGERITISYNVNGLVVDATANLEAVRPITADVLVKEAEELLVDVSGTILINEDAIGEADKIVDSVIGAVSSALSTARLGAIVDYSDIVSVAAAQNGVDSINIALFNESGKFGRKAFVKALDNQTISAGNISFEAVSRNKFRIN